MTAVPGLAGRPVPLSPTSGPAGPAGPRLHPNLQNQLDRLPRKPAWGQRDAMGRMDTIRTARDGVGYTKRELFAHDGEASGHWY